MSKSGPKTHKNTTLPETNSKSSESGWLEDEFPFGGRGLFSLFVNIEKPRIYFLFSWAFAVSFGEGIFSAFFLLEFASIWKTSCC